LISNEWVGSTSVIGWNVDRFGIGKNIYLFYNGKIKKIGVYIECYDENDMIFWYCVINLKNKFVLL